MVLNADGKLVWEKIVETQAGPIIDLLESLSGELHVTFEETTQADWLYNVVRGYVSEVIVCDPRRNKLLSDGSKTDRVDALKLAGYHRCLAQALGEFRTQIKGRSPTGIATLADLFRPRLPDDC